MNSFCCVFKENFCKLKLFGCFSCKLNLQNVFWNGTFNLKELLLALQKCPAGLILDFEGRFSCHSMKTKGIRSPLLPNLKVKFC